MPPWHVTLIEHPSCHSVLHGWRQMRIYDSSLISLDILANEFQEDSARRRPKHMGDAVHGLLFTAEPESGSAQDQEEML